MAGQAEVNTDDFGTPLVRDVADDVANAYRYGAVCQNGKNAVFFMSASKRSKADKPLLLAVILVTQRGHGECLLEAAAHFTGETPADVVLVPLLGNESCGDIDSKLRTAIAQFGGREILLLCDLFGSTHANIAGDIAAESANMACVSGLNLAMLMESYTVRRLSASGAAARAAKAGKQGVVQNGALSAAKKQPRT